jgi:hypothetical protein
VRIGAVLALVAGCGFETTVVLAQPGDASTVDTPVVIPDAPPGAWLAGYSHRKPIAVTRAGTTTLADFPIGIVLASDADLAARARPDGRDIVVTTGDAMTRIDSELVSFGSNGALELWTRVPSLPPATTTILYVYYGGPASTTNPAGVFPTARFKGVWHLSDATPANAADSTPHAHALTTAGSAIPTAQQGVAGSARMHDGVDDKLEIADPIDGSLDVGTQSFAYSAWIRSSGTVDVYDNPFFKGGTSAGNPGYCIMTGTFNPWIGKLHDGNTYAEIALAPTTTLNQWLHLVVVVDRSVTPAKGRGFVNGVMTSDVDVTLGSLNTTRELSLGAGSNGALFHGLIDEARIYNTALTADWIATEYANLATPGFITKGNEETMP